MRNLPHSIIGLLAGLALAACGPSGKQVASAQQARYQGNGQELFAVVKEITAESHKILKADDASMGLQTMGRWYTAQGQPMADVTSLESVPDQAVNVSLIVELVPDGTQHKVVVRPVLARKEKGIAQPKDLDPKDPTVPEWVASKGEKLAVQLFEALKKHEATPGAAPAAAPAPAATPADGAAAGSAAPAAPTP
jgi:hypothetical protein